MSAPGAFVIGAAKCGTTTLHRWLGGHPQVFLPRGRKEIGYFAADVVGGPRSREAYLALYEEAGDRVAVDVSTPYLYDAGAPRRVRDEIGLDVRVVAILRHPARMAFSLWKQMVKDGREPLSFPAALAAEPERMADERFRARAADWHANHYYASRARYAPQLERWLDVFGRERVRVFVFERFFADGAPEWPALLEHLGVDPGYRPTRLGRDNPGGVTRSPWLRSYLRRRSWIKSFVTRPLGESAKHRLKRRLFDWNTKPYRETADDRRALAELAESCRPEVRRLGELLGEDLEAVWYR